MANKKIIWAVDPFSNVAVLDKVMQLLKQISAREDVTVEPVYVLSPDQLSLAIEYAQPSVEPYVPQMQKALEKKLQKYKASFLRAPKVLLQNLPSTRSAVDAMIKYADDDGADLIIASTHARKGAARFFLGSFAETLYLYSKIPVLLVNPKVHKAEKIKHIIFPTDFSEASWSSFAALVTLAQELKAKITIFHKVLHPIEPIIQSGVHLLGGVWVPVQQYFGQEVERRGQDAKKWANWAKGQKVRVDVCIDDSATNTPDAIIRVAKKQKCQLIALTAKVGSVGAALIGSTARQVVRNAPVPIWIFHPTITNAARTNKSKTEYESSSRDNVVN